MTLLSPVAAIPYPALTDAPNMQTAMATMTSSLDSMVVPRYSTLAILTAAVPTPTTGQQVFLTGSNAFVYWNGTAWVASGSALISNTVVGSAVATVTLSSIPQVFTHLRLVIQAVSSTANGLVTINFNGDAGSNYSTFDGSAITSTSPMSWSTLPLNVNTTLINGGRIPTTAVTNPGGIVTIDISSYSSTSNKKAVLSQSLYAGSQVGYGWGGGRWNSTTAVTSIGMAIASGGNFNVGSTFSLYGMP